MNVSINILFVAHPRHNMPQIFQAIFSLATYRPVKIQIKISLFLISFVDFFRVTMQILCMDLILKSQRKCTRQSPFLDTFLLNAIQITPIKGTDCILFIVFYVFSFFKLYVCPKIRFQNVLLVVLNDF